MDPGRARFVVGARLVPAERPLDVPGVAWLPDQPRGIRSGRRATDDGIGVVDWQRGARGWTAATAAYGRNNEPGGDFNALLAEATHVVGAHHRLRPRRALRSRADLLRFGMHGFVGGARTRTCRRGSAASSRSAPSRSAARGRSRVRRDGTVAAGADVDVLRRSRRSSSRCTARHPVSASLLLPPPSAGADGPHGRRR